MIQMLNGLNVFLLGLAGVAFVAVALGEPTVVFVYVETYVRLALAAVCLLVALYFLRLNILVFRNKEAYNRNRKATLLLQKSRRGMLSTTEAEQLRYCQRQ